MAEVLSKEHYLAKFERQSSILNIEKPDRKKRPSGAFLDMSLSGMKEQLYAINTKDKSPDDPDVFLGSLAYARHLLKEARDGWSDFKSRQAHLTKDSKPEGVFLENINKREAKILTLEKTSRKLIHLVEKLESEQIVAEKKAKEKPSYRKRMSLSGKLRDGKLFIYAGRDVHQCPKTGANLFTDDNSSVDLWIRQEKKRRLDTFKAKAEEQRLSEKEKLKAILK